MGRNEPRHLFNNGLLPDHFCMQHRGIRDEIESFDADCLLGPSIEDPLPQG